MLDTQLETATAPSAAPAPDALRLQVAERLAAHRSRRAAMQQHPAARPAGDPTRKTDTRAARIAAAVAERYAQSQSYRAFLAAEAERAIQQAQAAAEVAAMNAQAVAAAQLKLLEEFDQSAQRSCVAVTEEIIPEAGFEPRAVAVERRAPVAQEQSFWPEPESERPATRRTAKQAAPAPVVQSSRSEASGFSVRLYEDAAGLIQRPLGSAYLGSTAQRGVLAENTEAEAHALDEEIAFRQAPVFEEPAEPPMPLPANLIEFPRQLVASRKARPRYAEGPLRDEADAEAADGQLRIFEVDPGQISTEPEVATEAATASQWTSLWLDAAPAMARTEWTHAQAEGTTPAQDEAYDSAGLPQVAPLGRRALAVAVNAGIIAAGAAVFAAGVYATTRDVIDWQGMGMLRSFAASLASHGQVEDGLSPALVLGSAALAVVFLYLLFQGLFSTLAGVTPGMRCARIALCTFDDNNPSRKAMRRRIPAVLLSACPLGLGFLWATLDDERLTWHDRLCRMYPRGY